MTDQEAIEYIASLAALEQDPGHQRAVVTMGPFSAFVAIGTWQLAMRHPEFSPWQADLVHQLIDQLKPLFAGTPGAELIDLGNDPARDVVRTCQHPFGPHSPECPPGEHSAPPRLPDKLTDHLGRTWTRRS